MMTPTPIIAFYLGQRCRHPEHGEVEIVTAHLFGAPDEAMCLCPDGHRRRLAKRELRPLPCRPVLRVVARDGERIDA